MSLTRNQDQTLYDFLSTTFKIILSVKVPPKPLPNFFPQGCHNIDLHTTAYFYMVNVTIFLRTYHTVKIKH